MSSFSFWKKGGWSMLKFYGPNLCKITILSCINLREIFGNLKQGALNLSVISAGTKTLKSAKRGDRYGRSGGNISRQINQKKEKKSAQTKTPTVGFN